MDTKTNAMLSEPVKLDSGRRVLLATGRLYLGCLLLGATCLAVSLLAFPLWAVLPRAHSRRIGRKLVAASAGTYLRCLVLIGVCRLDLAALDALRGAPAMIIAPNHPSLLDAVLILSRLPAATCIIKADIANSALFGMLARVTGYIRNTPLRAMVKSAVAELRHGSHVLLFPEGTRTTRFPVGSLQGTGGLIAKKAGVPVQTVFIETDSGFLGKGWSPLRTPRMPITYRIRLGRRFDAPTHTAHFVSELEQYFQSELTRAPGPEFPATGPSA